jgi:hypothetical protein
LPFPADLPRSLEVEVGQAAGGRQEIQEHFRSN